MRAVPPRTVLVTDGEERSSLAAVRSLGRAGHHVFACAKTTRSLAAASRYCRATAAVPSPLSDPAGYLSAVQRLCAEWGVDALVPMTEPSLLALLPSRDRLGVLIPFPTLESFRAISDKERLLRTAGQVGIAIPEQRVLARPEDAVGLDAGALHFPVVLKPSRSVVGENGTRQKTGVRHAADAEELREQLAGFPPAAYPILVQQRIVGPGVGVFLLVWGGSTRAVFGHRRLREKPPAGGVSVYRESVAVDEEMLQRSRELLELFGWEGVAMLEFKLDEATGTPYLMEVNGRLWGSLQLAIDAGVDFPALLLEAASGASTGEVPQYRVGVRSRWWWGEVDHLLMRLRYSARELALPPGAPSRAGAVRDFFRRHPLDREEILRVSDLRPFLRETLNWFGGR